MVVISVISRYQAEWLRLCAVSSKMLQGTWQHRESMTQANSQGPGLCHLTDLSRTNKDTKCSDDNHRQLLNAPMLPLLPLLPFGPGRKSSSLDMLRTAQRSQQHWLHWDIAALSDVGSSQVISEVWRLGALGAFCPVPPVCSKLEQASAGSDRSGTCTLHVAYLCIRLRSRLGSQTHPPLWLSESSTSRVKKKRLHDLHGYSGYK